MMRTVHLPCLPSLKCFTEIKDIEVFKPIQLWVNQLSGYFNQKIKPLTGTDNVNNEDLEIFGNQYTLLLMLAGKNELCEKSLRQIIDYYHGQYETTKSPSYLDKMAQPVINLARLYRLGGKNKLYHSVINGLESRSGDINLGGINIKLKDLSEKHRELIRNVCGMEKLKHALSRKKFTEILSTHDNGPLVDCFSEAKVVALIATGRYSDAESIIHEQIESTEGFTRLAFYFRLYEMMKLTSKEKEARTIAETLRQLVLRSSQAPLACLILFTHYLLLDPDIKVARHIIKLYEGLGEELNLGLFLVSLHIHTHIDVKNRLIKLGEKTGYELLQKKIDAIFSKRKKSSADNEQVLMHVKNCFTSVFGDATARF